MWGGYTPIFTPTSMDRYNGPENEKPGAGPGLDADLDTPIVAPLRAARKRIDYPPEFDSVARAKMVAARIEATREMYGAWPSAQSDVLLAGTQYTLGTGRVFEYIMSIFSAFANEACVLGRVGRWSTDRIDGEAREFLRLITIEAETKYSGRADLRLPKMTDNEIITLPIMDQFETYQAWQRFQSDLLQVAKIHAQERNLGAVLAKATQQVQHDPPALSLPIVHAMHANQGIGDQMLLTPQQRDLLFAIVDSHASSYGSRFTFTHGRTGSGLYYPGNRSVRVDADDDDLGLLERKRLVIILSKAPGALIVINGQLTQLGIDTAASLRNKPAPSTVTSNDRGGDERRPEPSVGLQLDESLDKNPFPNDDPRHEALAPLFEVKEKFEVLAEEYPTLSVEWRAEEAKWLPRPRPLPAVGEGERSPSSPGSDLHVKASAGEAGQRLLGSPESWFNPGRDPWLDVNQKEPWEHWLYAIREFWLNAGEEAEDAGADMHEFAKAAEAVGYWPSHNPFAVGERVWRKMVKSKKSLQESMHELGLSTFEEIDKYEEPAGWVQRGQIQHLFKGCANFCGALAARRVQGELPIPGPSNKPEPEETPAVTVIDGLDVPDQPDAAGRSEQDVQRGSLPVSDSHVDLLGAIIIKRPTTLEKWAKEHKLGRTTVFDWKALRSAGKPLSGKVSTEKSDEIEAAIEKDAEALGLITRTPARTSSD